MGDELISRQELLNKLNELDQQALYLPCHFKDFIVDQVLSVQRKNGQWVKSRIPKSILCECNICGYDCGAYSMNYCPNCGAKMEVEENED